MKKEKLEQYIKTNNEKLRTIEEKYAKKREELENAYKKEIASYKEKEKQLNEKLKNIENEEKLKMVSKIPYDKLQEFFKTLDAEDRKINKMKADGVMDVEKEMEVEKKEDSTNEEKF